MSSKSESLSWLPVKREESPPKSPSRVLPSRLKRPPFGSLDDVESFSSLEDCFLPENSLIVHFLKNAYRIIVVWQVLNKHRKMRGKKGQIRIIGGRWRSRKLWFPNTTTLRPSPDAVRETLFNWLQHDIQQSHCLDLFAGSGALGFEAASRGAASVVMVESDPEIACQLEQNKVLLEAEENVIIVNSSAAQFIENCDQQFDLLFLDPPFGSCQLEQSCIQLDRSRIIAPGALLYIESPKNNIPLPIPPSWHIIRQKTRGLVQSTLIETEYE